MPQVWHLCITQGPQQPAPHDWILPQGIGEEVALPGGVGGTGGYRVVYHSLWDTPRPVHLLQVSWDSFLGGRRQLDGGDTQPVESMAEVGVDDSVVEQGGWECLYLGPDLLGGVSVSHDLRVGDVDHDTAHWEGFGRISLQGGPQADEEATSERNPLLECVMAEAGM